MIICPQCQTINEVQTTRCAACDGPLLAGEPVLDDDPFVGRVFGGRFQLLARLGSGEIGMVYQGLDTSTKQEATVKLIHPDVAATIGEELMHSARQLMKLSHPKIARVLAAAREPDGTLYLASEHVSGQTLKTLLEANGPLGPRRAADILFQLCSALAPIHRLNRPHANLKPENVFLVEREGAADFVQIVDVGVPELFGNRQTTEGQVVIGTPKYFSPEQATGRPVGLASDQFTLGVIGYQLLTGALPFFGATPDQLLTAIATAAPTPVSKRTAGVVLPPRLEQVIDRCLQKDPAARYPDLRALATDLADVIKSTQPEPAPARRAPRTPFVNASTTVAGPNALAELLAGEEEDGDGTVVRDLPAQFTGGLSAEPTPNVGPAVQMLQKSARTEPSTRPPAGAAAGPSRPPAPPRPPAPRAPSPPTQNDMAAIPEPLMVTGALDSDDLARALAEASASLDPEAPAKRGPRPEPDLDAAFAAALADVGFEAPVKGGRPSSPPDPFSGMPLDDVPASPEGRAAEAAAKVPRGQAAQRLTTEIMSAIDEEVVDASGPVSLRASPLATAADLVALAPPTNRDSKSAVPGARRPGAQASAGRGAAVAMAAVGLLAAGGAGWWFLLREAPEAPYVSTPRPAPASVAAASLAAPSAPASAEVAPGSQAAPGSEAAPASLAGAGSDGAPPSDAPAVVLAQQRIQEQEAAKKAAEAAGMAAQVAAVARVLPVHLESVPEGAAVKCGNDPIGTTPTDHLFNLDAPCEYAFSFDGYENATRAVTVKEPPPDGKPHLLQVTLAKAGAPKPPAPRPAAAPTGPPTARNDATARPPAPKPPAPKPPKPKADFKDPFE